MNDRTEKRDRKMTAQLCSMVWELPHLHDRKEVRHDRNSPRKTALLFMPASPRLRASYPINCFLQLPLLVLLSFAVAEKVLLRRS